MGHIAPRGFMTVEHRSIKAVTIPSARRRNEKGFKTLWQRCVLKAIQEKVLTAETCFTFHDLRAHYTTYFKAQFGALPESQANPATTAKVYERSKEVRRQSL